MNGRFTIRHVWEVRIGRKILNYCGSMCLVQVESGNFLLIDRVSTGPMVKKLRKCG